MVSDLLVAEKQWLPQFKNVQEVVTA